jgi:hypothetical protein
MLDTKMLIAFPEMPSVFATRTLPETGPDTLLGIPSGMLIIIA